MNSIYYNDKFILKYFKKSIEKNFVYFNYIKDFIKIELNNQNDFVISIFDNFRIVFKIIEGYLYVACGNEIYCAKKLCKEDFDLTELINIYLKIAYGLNLGILELDVAYKIFKRNFKDYDENIYEEIDFLEEFFERFSGFCSIKNFLEEEDYPKYLQFESYLFFTGDFTC